MQNMPNTDLHAESIDLNRSQKEILSDILHAVTVLMQHVHHWSRLQRRFDDNLYGNTRQRSQRKVAIEQKRKNWAQGLRVKVNSYNSVPNRNTSTRRINRQMAERDLIHFCSDLRVNLSRIAPGLRVSRCSSSL